jgi:His-Xaa-Ser system protein HxsD
MESTEASQMVIERLSDKSYRIIFDRNLYSLPTLKKAAYKFAAECSIVFSCDESSNFVANMLYADSYPISDQQMCLQMFCGEVIDQDLREQIATATEPTRNLILAEAFSKTSLLHGE